MYVVLPPVWNLPNTNVITNKTGKQRHRLKDKDAGKSDSRKDEDSLDSHIFQSCVVLGKRPVDIELANSRPALL